MTMYQVLRTDYPMEVHAIGCSHNNRKVLDLDWKITGDTVEIAVEHEAASLNRDLDSTYKTTELFRIMPCCKLRK
jgi:hypothetical protein